RIRRALPRPDNRVDPALGRPLDPVLSRLHRPTPPRTADVPPIGRALQLADRQGADAPRAPDRAAPDAVVTVDATRFLMAAPPQPSGPSGHARRLLQHAVWTRFRHRQLLRRRRPPADPAHRTTASPLPHPHHALTPGPRGPPAPPRGTPSPIPPVLDRPPQKPAPRRHTRLPRSPPPLTQPATQVASRFWWEVD